MSNKKEMTGAERKASILEAGAKLASKHGVRNVTRRMVAKAAKVSEALVSSYMGGTAVAQNAYGRKAKALKLPLPDKATAEKIGAKLRAHGPRDARDTRKRSAKEVEAIKRKIVNPKVKVAAKKSAVDLNVKSASTRAVAPSVGKAGAAKKSAAVAATRATAVRTPRATASAPAETKPAAAPKPIMPVPASAPVQAPPANKTAARLPKAPPTLPAAPSQGQDVGIGSGSPSPAS